MTSDREAGHRIPSVMLDAFGECARVVLETSRERVDEYLAVIRWPIRSLRKPGKAGFEADLQVAFFSHDARREPTQSMPRASSSLAFMVGPWGPGREEFDRLLRRQGWVVIRPAPEQDPEIVPREAALSLISNIWSVADVTNFERRIFQALSRCRGLGGYCLEGVCDDVVSNLERLTSGPLARNCVLLHAMLNCSPALTSARLAAIEESLYDLAPDGMVLKPIRGMNLYGADLWPRYEVAGLTAICICS